MTLPLCQTDLGSKHGLLAEWPWEKLPNICKPQILCKTSGTIKFVRMHVASKNNTYHSVTAQKSALFIPMIGTDSIFLTFFF